MTKLWGKSPEEIAAERHRMIAQREARNAAEALERDKAMQARLNEGRTPEELGAYYSSYLPPDAPLVLKEMNWSPSMSVDSWVDPRAEPIMWSEKPASRKLTGWETFWAMAAGAMLGGIVVWLLLEAVRAFVAVLL